MVIRYFSQILIQTSKAFSDVIWNKQLFSITQIESPEMEINSDTELISAKSIDDATFLKSLIDFLLNKSDGSSTEYRNKVLAVDKMKLLAIKSGIINLDELENIDRLNSEKT